MAGGLEGCYGLVTEMIRDGEIAVRIHRGQYFGMHKLWEGSFS
jgi:hypothetical protein